MELLITTKNTACRTKDIWEVVAWMGILAGLGLNLTPKGLICLYTREK